MPQKNPKNSPVAPSYAGKLSAKGRPRPKGPRKPVFCDFSPLGGRSAKPQSVRKLRNFREKILGRTDVFPKSAPSSGKVCFSVFGPELL